MNQVGLLEAAELLETVAAEKRDLLAQRLSILAELCRSSAADEDDGDSMNALTMATVLERLFPESHDPLTALRLFRLRARERAQASEIELTIAVDGKKRTRPESRHLWFEGTDSLSESRAQDRAMSESAAFSAATVEDVVPVDFRRVQTSIVIDFDEDDPSSQLLLERLQVAFSLRTDRAFDVVIPHARTGENIEDRRQRTLARADCIITLLTAKYLMDLNDSKSSVLKARGWIPVRLEVGIRPDSRGIDNRRLYPQHDDAVAPESEAFVIGLVDEVVGSLERADIAAEAELRRTLEEREDEEEPGNLVPSRVRQLGLRPSEVLKATQADPDRVYGAEQRDLQEYLSEWATDENARPYLAILGEYGMGKTTAVSEFTRVLLSLEDRAEFGPLRRLPIYIDLRLVVDLAASNPTLEQLLDFWAQRLWQTGEIDRTWSAREVVRAVQERGAIVIFDGLDEILVHLNQAQGQQFIRELWRTLPPSRIRSGRSGRGEVGRIIFTCRTHYFATLRDEAAFYRGEDREQVTGGLYDAVLLSPFNQRQIEAYLERRLDETEPIGPGRALALMREVHNLEELATRPVHLKMIVDQLDLIEKAKLAGVTVNAATLYQELCQRSLERDGGKHHIRADLKFVLMEELAAELWGRGVQRLPVEELRQWVEGLLLQPGPLQRWRETERNSGTAVSGELLLEDVHTATFVVRPGADGFGFAHTSLQEFFLASYLARALDERQLDRWALPEPSAETFAFLGQLIAERPDDRVAALAELRAPYRPGASELAFAYGLLAANSAADGAPGAEQAYPAPSLAGFDLSGANLAGLRIAGAANTEVGQPVPLLNLSGARFEGANLRNARFTRVRLDGAHLDQAVLATAEFQSCSLRNASFAGSDLAGAALRNSTTAGLDLARANLYRTRFVGCTDPPAIVLPVDDAASMASSVFNQAAPAMIVPNLTVPAPTTRSEHEAETGELVHQLKGHTGRVWAVAVDGGGRIVSAGDDNVVRVWDGQSGELVHQLKGHTGSVWAVAVDGGGRIVSAGDDNVVRVWDGQSGELVHQLKDHTGSVWAVAVDGGGRIVSAGDDNVVRVWDGQSGELVHQLKGHTGRVWAVAVDGGGRIVSAGDDGVVRVWDGQSGELVHQLKDHTGSVWAVAVDGGGRIVSAGDDNVVRVWDGQSGELVHQLKGHTGRVWAVAVDGGGRIVSAGDDGVVRVWDGQSGELVHQLKGHTGSVWAVAVDGGGRIVSAGDDEVVRVWDGQSGELVHQLKGHTGSVLAVAVDGGGRIVSAGDDEVVRVWDGQSGELVHQLKDHTGSVWAVAVDGGGRIVSAGDDGVVRVWDGQSGELVHQLKGHTGSVWAVAVDGGGRIVSAGDDNVVRVWDGQSGELVHQLKGHTGRVWAVAVDGGGRIVSAGDDEVVRVWDGQSGELVHQLKDHTGSVLAVAVDGGGRIVSAGDDKVVRVWDGQSGELVHQLKDHTGRVWAVAVDGGGRIVSAGDDEVVRVWDGQSGELVHQLKDHTGRVWAVAVDGGGRIVSAGDDEVVRVWDGQTGKRVARLEPLPEGEWAVIGYPEHIMAWSERAWRWLAWRLPHPETGHPVMVPAETFGLVPQRKLAVGEWGQKA